MVKTQSSSEWVSKITGKCRERERGNIKQKETRSTSLRTWKRNGLQRESKKGVRFSQLLQMSTHTCREEMDKKQKEEPQGAQRPREKPSPQNNK